MGKKTRNRCKKFADLFEGKFRVIERVGPATYRIDTRGRRIADVVHINRCKLAVSRNEHLVNKEWNEDESRNTSEESEEESQDEEVETYTVLNHRRRRNGLVFLIQKTTEPDDTGHWVARERKFEAAIDVYLAKQESYNSHEVDKPCVNNTELRLRIPTRGWLPFLFCLFFYLISQIGCEKTLFSPKLSEIYNCARTTLQGVYSAPNSQDCQKDLHLQKIEKFQVNVRLYKEEMSNIDVFFCEATRFDRKCSENFFAYKEKETTQEKILVSPEQCREAMYTKNTVYGPLVYANMNEWTTQNRKSYKCGWMDDNLQSFVTFSLKKFSAMAKGDDHILQQFITAKSCYITRGYCVPVEQKKAVLVWADITHDFDLYHDKGNTWAHKLGNFVLLHEFGVGSMIVKTIGRMMLLRNSYILRKINGVEAPLINQTSIEKFENYSRFFAKNVKTTISSEIFEGYLNKQLMKENKLMTSLAIMMCKASQDIFKLKWVNLVSYPDTSSPLWFNDKSLIMQTLGDGFLVRKCSKINHYRVIWDRKINKTCFQLFPVILGNNDTRFMELLTRQIVSNSNKIDCGEREKIIYIKDRFEKYWKYTLGKGFSKAKVKHPKYFSENIKLPKITSFNRRMLHFTKPRLHRMTLLAILAAQRQNLATLTDLKDVGDDNIVRGIAREMSRALKSVIHSGEDIFDIISGGVVHTVNDTVLTLESSGDLMVGLFQDIGGPGVFTLYLINMGIIAYLIYHRWREVRVVDSGRTQIQQLRQIRRGSC